MSFLSQSHLLTNADFVGRVEVAILTAATDITGETGFDQHSPSSSRFNLAAQINMGYQPGYMQFINACALNTTIAGAEDTAANSSADSDIQYVINSNWDRIADLVAYVAPPAATA